MTADRTQIDAIPDRDAAQPNRWARRIMDARPCWSNCRIGPTDDEIERIDAMEDALSPLPADLKAIRRLITSLEMCHHKAERWVTLIIEAIADGKTSKGPGTRPEGSRHPAEVNWQKCVCVLSAWCDGTAVPDNVQVGGISARELALALGQTTAIRKWQVQRAIDKVRPYVEPDLRYVEIEENEGHFISDAEFRKVTMSTMIREHVAGQPAEISLAAAIDHLEACHWDFMGNLMIVLNAIGGDLSPSRPYAACGRNINLSPIRPRMKEISDTVRSYWDDSFTASNADVSLLDVLGDKTPEKRWLAASLDKTVRLQFGL